MSRGDVDDSEESLQKLTEAWRVAVRLVREKPKELKKVNDARKILRDPGLREAYHVALDRYNIEDGKGIDNLNESGIVQMNRQ